MSTRQLLGPFAFWGAFLANDVRRLLLGTSTSGYVPPHNLWNPILFARIFYFISQVYIVERGVK